MGAGHSHSHTEHPEPTPQTLAARKKANWILAAILIPLTLLTLAAMAFMWPSGSKEGITLASPYAAAPGVTFDTGKIQRVVVGSCSDAQAGGDAAAQQGASGSGDRAAAPERGLAMHVRLHRAGQGRQPGEGGHQP